MERMRQNKGLRKWLSVLLAVVMVLGYAGLFSGLLPGITAHAADDRLKVEDWNVVISVPETVYMTPQSNFSDTTTSVQYYINNTVSSTGAVTLDVSNNATVGKFYVYSPQIKSIQSVSLNGATLSNLSPTKNGNLFSDTSFTFSLSSGLASKGLRTLEWTITCKMMDDRTATFYAWTVAYNPYLAAVVSGGYIQNTRDNNHTLDGFAWTSGIHGIESDGNWYTIAGCSPLGHTITTGGGSSSSGDDWFYDNCIFSSVQFGQDKKNAYYWSYDWGGYWSGRETDEVQEVTPWGLLTVDTSRNTNLNTIPNITTGFHITGTGTKSKQPDIYGYICNLTESVATKKDSDGHITSGADHWQDSRIPTWYKERGTILWGSSDDTGKWIAKTDSCRETQSVLWNCSVTGTGTQYCYTKTGLYSKDGSQDDRNFLNLVGRVKVTKVNKSSWRTAINNAQKYGFQADAYDSTDFNNWKNALKAVYEAVCDPTNSTAPNTTNLTNYTNTLYNKKHSSKAQVNDLGVVKVLDSYGDFNNTYKVVSLANVTNPIAESDVYARQSVVLNSTTYTGFTYKGNLLSKNQKSAGETFTNANFNTGLGIINTDTSIKYNHLSVTQNTNKEQQRTFYYLGDDKTLTVKPNGGIWGGSTADKTVTGSYTGSFTPSDPDPRTGYTFDGWELTGGGTWEDGVYTFGSEAGTLTAKWSANRYNITLDNLFDFGSYRKSNLVNAGNHGTISAVTDTGFTLTSTGSDSYTQFSTQSMPVTAGRTYLFSADTVFTKNADNFEFFIDWRDSSDAHLSYQSTSFSAGGYKAWEVSAPAGAAYAKVRFDANNTGNVLTVSNIRFVEVGTDNITNKADQTASAYNVMTTFDADYPQLPVPTKTGYTFDGWYLDSACTAVNKFTDANGNVTMQNKDGVVANGKVKLTATLNLYAKWVKGVYTLTFDPGEGSINQGVSATKQVTYDNAIGTLLAANQVSRPGYTLAGWAKTANATTPDVTADTIYTGPDFPGGNGTIYAVWSANTYNITYNIGTNDAMASWADNGSQKSVVFDSVMTAANFPATTPTRPGYTFEGWNTVQNATSANFAVGDTFTNAGNITVYAAWKPITYTANFNAAGGTAAAQKSFDRPNGFTFPESERTGYTLLGWKVSAGDGNWDGDETVYAAGAPVSDKYGDVTFVAQWEANEYTVTYSTAVADSATNLAVTVEPASFTATYDAALGELAVPTRDGFDFVGWYLDAALTQAVDSETEFKTSAGFTANNNNVLYSKWTPKTYHITVLDASGYEIAALSRDYTPVDSFTIVPPVITGKTFDVWVQRTVNQGNWSEGRYSAETVFAGRYGDVTLQANYLEVQYKAYWYNGDTLMQFENFSTGEMVDHTLHVLGSLPYVTVVPTKESTPEKTFEFEGWFDANGNAPHTLTEADITNGDDTTFTFYARYIEHDRAYTVNWNVTGLPGATTYAPSQVVWGTAFGAEGFTLPEGLNTTVEGYDCEIKVGDTVVTDAYVMPKNDITVDVTFTAQDRTIDWYSEDGNTLLVSTVQKYGEDVHTPAQSGTAITVPEKAGDSKYQSYTFNDRWSNLALGEPVNLGVVATPDASEHMSFYVSYTHGDPVEYTVTWVIASDVVDPAYRSRTTTVGYGEPLSINIAPEIPVVDGYAIMWNFADAPDTMPDSNITINAVVEAGSWIVRWNVTGRQEVMTMVRDGEQAVPTNVFTDRPTDSKYSYTFIGWSSDPAATEYDETPAADSFYAYEDGGVNELPLISQASARTFYAVYLRTAQEYTITWKVDNRVVQVDTVAYGQPVTEYAVPEKPGKTFVGWIDDLGAEVEIPATMIDRDIIANAVYETTRYTFRWYADGRLVDTTVFDYNVKPFTNVTPTKASTAQYDYSFIGWALTPDATAADVIQYMQPATADGEFYAVFESTLRQYRLRIFRDGRVVSSETTFVANGASLEATLNAIIENYQRNGYDAKWTEVSFDDDNTFIQGADFTVAGAVMPTNNFDLNIAYTAKNYTITWIIDGVESYTEVPYGELITHEDPTKASDLEYNYTFTGWSPKLTSNTRCTGEATFEANFSATPREYTITWVGFGKTETSTARVGAIISYTRPVPAKEGHTGQWVQEFESMPAEDITINAEYTPRVYRVTWKADGRTLYTEEVTFGAAIPSKEIPEKDGYTGVWDNEVETMPARNIVITAVYSLKTWAITVKFATDDSYNHEVTYNSTYTANFVAANGSLPEDIIVSVSGKKIGANNYTYSADGSFVLNANVITGPVTIVDAVEGSQVVIDEIRVNGLQPIAGRTAKAGMAYHVQFIAMQGYELPTDVDVYIDGERLTSGYSYDARTGRLTINGEKMYGTVKIVPLEPEKKPDAPTPTDPSDPGNQGGSSGGTCPYCGKVHTGFFGFLVQFFHMILYFFRNLFGRG